MFDREVFDLPKYTHLLENIPYRNLVRHLPLEHFQNNTPTSHGILVGSVSEKLNSWRVHKSPQKTENHFHSLTQKTDDYFSVQDLTTHGIPPPSTPHLVFNIHLGMIAEKRIHGTRNMIFGAWMDVSCPTNKLLPTWNNNHHIETHWNTIDIFDLCSKGLRWMHPPLNKTPIGTWIVTPFLQFHHMLRLWLFLLSHFLDHLPVSINSWLVNLPPLTKQGFNKALLRETNGQ